MDQTAFQTAEPFLDKIAEIIDDALVSERLAHLRIALIELGQAIGERYSVSLDLMVQVFDREQERGLPLLNTGLSLAAGEEPYRTYGDSTPQRYVVDGQIQVVPHDRCPKCWDVWDFKFDTRSCRNCKTALGENCKVLLDADVCPYCEHGKVSMANPTCDQCGHKVDLSVVTWG